MNTIAIGNKKIKGLYFGPQKVKKIYIGNTLIFDTDAQEQDIVVFENILTINNAQFSSGVIGEGTLD